MNYQYSDGTTNFGELPNEEILRRVAANPEGKNLVWREGMAEWKNAIDLPEFSLPEKSVPEPKPEAKPATSTAPDSKPEQKQQPVTQQVQPAPSKKSNKGLLVGVGVVAVVAIVALVYVFAGGGSDIKDMDTQFTSGVEAFNKKFADASAIELAKYDGQVFELVGYPGPLWTDHLTLTSTPTSGFPEEDDFVNCSFDKYNDQFADLDKEQEIIVKGICKVKNGYAHLVDCMVISRAESSFKQSSEGDNDYGDEGDNSSEFESDPQESTEASTDNSLPEGFKKLLTEHALFRFDYEDLEFETITKGLSSKGIYWEISIYLMNNEKYGGDPETAPLLGFYKYYTSDDSVWKLDMDTEEYEQIR